VNTLKTPSPPAIDRALGLLELLAHSHHGLTLAEVAERMGIPRSSAHTILLSLERRDWLRRSAKTRRYLFGPKLFSLASRALGGMSLRETAAPALKALQQQTGLSVHAAILEENQAVLVEQFVPPQTRAHTWVGKRMDLHCTALGKVLLAWLPEESVRQIVSGRVLSRHNENTKASPRRLLEELQETRKRGYAVDDEEAEIGYRCLGAPVFDASGTVIAAISVSGTTAQLHFVNAAPVAAQLCATAAEIAQAIIGGQKDK
jgi:DNA-binding IclR family transcriptional regulator